MRLGFTCTEQAANDEMHTSEQKSLIKLVSYIVVGSLRGQSHWSTSIIERQPAELNKGCEMLGDIWTDNGFVGYLRTTGYAHR